MGVEVNSVSEVLKAVIQTGAIVIGWVVVHKLSAARDRDKARREMLVKAADSLNEEIGKLFIGAKDYHSKARELGQEVVLKMTFQDLSARTNLLSDICGDHKELASCRSAILAMKKAISSAHFEDEHIEPLDLGSPQIQTITAEALRAKQSFLRLKHRQFPIE
jgi:hypothetical protein